MTQNTKVAYERDRTMDILRGFAITFMIGSHTADYLFIGTHSLWFMLYASMAAPLFVFVAGVMVALTFLRRKHDFLYYLKRGIAILVMAVFVDVVIWNTYPFISFDILYLLGFAIPLTYLFLRLDRYAQLVLTISIFLITPLLQDIIGSINLAEIYLAEDAGTYALSIKHLMTAGWFPLFPWLGYSFLGALFGSVYYQKGQSKLMNTKAIAVLSILFFIVGSIGISLLISDTGIGGYMGLLFAPTLSYMMWTFGIMGLLFVIVRATHTFVLYKPFELLGTIALLLYILHLAIIAHVLNPFYWKSLGFVSAFLAFIGLMSIFVVLAYGLRRVKERLAWRDKPWIVRFFLGG